MTRHEPTTVTDTNETVYLFQTYFHHSRGQWYAYFRTHLDVQFVFPPRGLWNDGRCDEEEQEKETSDTACLHHLVCFPLRRPWHFPYSCLRFTRSLTHSYNSAKLSYSHQILWCSLVILHKLIIYSRFTTYYRYCIRLILLTISALSVFQVLTIPTPYGQYFCVFF